MRVVAFDIETCPLPEYSELQLKRYVTEKRRLAERDSGKPPDEIDSTARSCHPGLGRVCAIAIAYHTPEEPQPIGSTSWSAAAPGDEADMLGRFWRALDASAQKGPHHYVSFNGKHFDSPFLLVRSLAHKIELPPVASRILDRHRWNNVPHWDLVHAFEAHMGLVEVCDLLGVQSPKDGLDGSGVAGAVEAGQIADVARYCEADARATLLCADTLARLAPFIP